MRKISVITGSRAEFSLLRRIIEKIEASSKLELCLYVTGSHLNKAFGSTVDEIKACNIQIEREVRILNEDNSESGITYAMARALEEFGKIFAKDKPELCLVLGDRYEILSVVTAALIHKIPIAHIHGGEETVGAIDNSIRNAITKMAHIHFPCAEIYKEKIIKMGENPKNIFNFGAPGIENILNLEEINLKELNEKFGFQTEQPYIIVTYHPTTIDGDSLTIFDNLFKKYSQFNFVITMPNADANSNKIRDYFKSAETSNLNVKCFDSLGEKFYLSALKNAEVCLGNSSSGIIEAPYLETPTVNIGNRQKGRIIGDSIFNAKAEESQIFDAFENAVNFGGSFSKPFGEGNASMQIVKVLEEIDLSNILSKEFYSI